MDDNAPHNAPGPVDPPDPQHDPHPAQPPLVLPLIAPHCSTRLCQPAQYVHNLLQGEGSITGTNHAQALPKGMQRPTNDEVHKQAEVHEQTEGRIADETLRELATNVAMIAHMANFDGIEPRNAEEAKKHHDWDKWKDAISEELNRL
ncbi:hypothetical protein SERLA73DRAFT_69995 [Serpula lacrymans var. lacrymans S7.3]|uniref:Uncharacterized protein n=2 Tax=Serpula lacrymans var. lacrymans TaxID=341189 RepID=F8PLK8_SERL3|nr:uncharacterized protein SERLADRAFT_434077 [Serpula lacrymans var. lacrymans S7.9]EGO02490.1 hypothetical protein SERLA73DRAFT_69995 [Serpula lacrymans var. lacrymans S7.3]EGO28206.1 hypothetical protein SERLADRAFT_434077 [Serpula lacrymans var. lacrymans S7.9]